MTDDKITMKDRFHYWRYLLLWKWYGGNNSDPIEILKDPKTKAPYASSVLVNFNACDVVSRTMFGPTVYFWKNWKNEGSLIKVYSDRITTEHVCEPELTTLLRLIKIQKCAEVDRCVALHVKKGRMSITKKRTKSKWEEYYYSLRRRFDVCIDSLNDLFKAQITLKKAEAEKVKAETERIKKKDNR